MAVARETVVNQEHEPRAPLPLCRCPLLVHEILTDGSTRTAPSLAHLEHSLGHAQGSMFAWRARDHGRDDRPAIGNTGLPQRVGSTLARRTHNSQKHVMHTAHEVDVLSLPALHPLPHPVPLSPQKPSLVRGRISEIVSMPQPAS
eukprot:11449247-Alexandrium_andersonii.AAC.1